MSPKPFVRNVSDLFLLQNLLYTMFRQHSGQISELGLQEFNHLCYTILLRAYMFLPPTIYMMPLGRPHTETR